MATTMTAELTITVGSRLIYKGEMFEAINEEDARLYEQKGLASRAKKKDKKQEPSRTQDVQTESPQPARRGRPPKKRQTKDSADSSEQEMSDGDGQGSAES